ncbi:hypothetical protein M3152_16770 [Sporosarcina luteola]|uniref:hypothetical protein n=1 Tax=Sporosarcina luteola TaxID=582850 RepID=UPI00203F19DD|nr:hypothetical protein [Sporosarcina luteola]MCM3639351.1 hypothetical protein [Sporosarcina luteola]
MILRDIDHFPADNDHFLSYIVQLEGVIDHFPTFIDHFPRYMVISGPLDHLFILFNAAAVRLVTDKKYV